MSVKETGEKDTSVRKRNGLYAFVKAVANVVFRTLFPLKVEGLENIQNADKPYILVSNHLHALDPAVIAFRLKNVEVTFLGKKEAMESGIGKWFCSKMGMIPVQRHSADLSAVRSCMQVLKAGGVLGIFPEGTRHNESPMKNVESGTALIALRGRADIQPVYISEKLRPFRRIRVIYGKRLETRGIYEKGTSNTEVYELTEMIRGSVLALAGAGSGE
ncbi:MAG: hypothetical protein CW338_05100 [Clostridiales bacterium]|nr:hypothetical protein [Clostridiales bacterium]